MGKTKLVAWIRKLLSEKKIVDFYRSKEWIAVRKEVLREQNNECQECKKLGKITKANTVHHIQFVSKYPQLALSKFCTYEGKQHRNLIAVCAACHSKLHPEKNKKSFEKNILNEERW